MDKAFLYGHAKVTDVTNGNNTVVVRDAFTHAMLAHPMDQKNFFRNLKDSPGVNPAKPLPELMLVDVANFCHKTATDPCTLPNGKSYKNAIEAQQFLPALNDSSLHSYPPLAYTIDGSKEAPPNNVTVEKPQLQSSIWPVDNTAPKNPFYFLFFVAPAVHYEYTTVGNMTSNGAK
jgi:hypothetical protein